MQLFGWGSLQAYKHTQQNGNSQVRRTRPHQGNVEYTMIAAVQHLIVVGLWCRVALYCGDTG